MLNFGLSLGNKVVVYYETRTPCMTGYTSPYGVVSASHELTDYWAWKGIDCSNVTTRDAWLTPSLENDAVSPENEEVWFEWKLTDNDLSNGMPLMIPTKVIIAPRKGMTESWYTSNNPYRLRIKGILEDNTEVTLVDEYQTDDWIGAGQREISINTDQSCRGLRVYILGTKAYDGGGTFHSGWGASYFEGIYPVSMSTDDMDGDGNPDVVIAQDGSVTVTEDDDSVNIDLDGDGVADIIIPKGD